MPKVSKSTCRPLWCLSKCKKSTSSLTSFLRYYTDNIQTIYLLFCKIIKLLFWELWKCLTISIKIIVSSYCKFSCLPASRKSTLSLTTFLRYCREIENSLFWEICAYLATHITNDSIKKRLTIISRGKSTPSFTFSLIYCKNIAYKVVVLGALGMPGHAHRKRYYQSVENFLYLSPGKKSIS